MKSILTKFVFFSLLLSSCGIWINPRYVMKSKKTRERFALEQLVETKGFFETKHNTYSVTFDKLKEVICSSARKNVLVVYFSHWCLSCHASMPKLKQVYQENRENLDIVFISSVDWLEVEADRELLDKYGFTEQSMLSIDIYKYGTEFMNWNRIRNFINELNSSNLEALHLPLYTLYDTNGNQLKFSDSTFDSDTFEILYQNSLYCFDTKCDIEF